MRLIDVLAFLTIATLLLRLISIIRIDSLREGNRSRAFKFIFGAYAVETMIPILRKGKTKDEKHWIRLSNILLALFYVLFASTMITILVMDG